MLDKGHQLLALFKCDRQLWGCSCGEFSTLYLTHRMSRGLILCELKAIWKPMQPIAFVNRVVRDSIMRANRHFIAIGPFTRFVQWSTIGFGHECSSLMNQRINRDFLLRSS
jgi:hypothetical protein